MLRFLPLLPLTLALGTAASAATVTETTDFSDDWLSPSLVAAGTTSLSGTVDDLDVLHLQGLASGAQELSFAFSAAPYYLGGDYTAGGTILVSAQAFRWSWDGAQTGYQVSFNSWNKDTPWYGESGALTSTAKVVLGADFAGGDLFLALAPWNGLKLDYTLTYVSAADPEPEAPIAAVPLPASGLMLAGVAGLALLARRRRA